MILKNHEGITIYTVSELIKIIFVCLKHHENFYSYLYSKILKIQNMQYNNT